MVKIDKKCRCKLDDKAKVRKMNPQNKKQIEMRLFWKALTIRLFITALNAYESSASTAESAEFIVN